MSLKEKLKKFKEKILNSSDIKSKIKCNEKDIVDITIFCENNIFIIQISDYISISAYMEKMKKIDKYEINQYICNSVLWNGSKQCVNKGTFYIIFNNDILYNIWINGDDLKIDERITKDNIIEEKLLFFNKSSNDYSYSSLKHDHTGSTFFTKFYTKQKKDSLRMFALSKEEAFNDIYSIISNLEEIVDIDNILNIDLLKEYILGDFKAEAELIKERNYRYESL